MLYLNFFGKIVSVMLDDKVTRTIVMESNDRDTLILIRDGVFNELSNDQPAIIKYSVLSDVQVIITIKLCNILYMYVII